MRAVKQADLEILNVAAASGEIRLLYLDQTGFDSWSPVSYSWSKLGAQKRQEQTHCRERISLLGLWEVDKEMTYGLCFGSVSGQTYLAMMQWLAKRAASHFQRSGIITVVVQDNASIHTCKLVKAQIQAWQEQGLYLFQLPPYCSEMNLIEGEWRQVKAHHVRGQMFENRYDLAMGVISSVRQRGEAAGYRVKRFNFNTKRTIRSSLLSV